MLPAYLVAIGALATVLVFVIGLRAARTRVISVCGLASVGCAIGASGFWAASGASELTTRIALSTLSIAGGLAHGVVFSIAALPKGKTWTRLLLVPLGMWTGTFTAMWFAIPIGNAVLGWILLLLASGTLTTWCLLPFWTRERGFVVQGREQIPSVRFPCPRCGTRVDWPRGVMGCTDCGLFVHLQWPADELHADPGHPVVLKPLRTVRFGCPECGVDREWPCGDSACTACGVKLSMHWNVHRGT